MNVVGAILAGGQSRRFGSSKADVLFNGQRLIDCVVEALVLQVQELVICGRTEIHQKCLADRPEAGLGPLGGLAAAIHFAAKNNFDYVLSAGCDTPNLPHDLLDRMKGDGPSILIAQPVIGFWPAALSQTLDTYLESGGRSLYGFADHAGARRVQLDHGIANINSREDLEKWSS